MPDPAVILEQLRAASNDAQYLAFVWHVVLGWFLTAVWIGWRVSTRVAATLIVLLCGTVSAVAWTFGNPFNAVIFATLSLVIGVTAVTRHPMHRRPVPLTARVAGSVMILFGWIYPHFLDASWTRYLLAAPLGVIPCPTLAAGIGMTIASELRHWRGWSWTLVTASMVYGAIGVGRLGVAIDGFLLVGALMLASDLLITAKDQGEAIA